MYMLRHLSDNGGTCQSPKIRHGARKKKRVRDLSVFLSPVGPSEIAEIAEIAGPKNADLDGVESVFRRLRSRGIAGDRGKREQKKPDLSGDSRFFYT